MKKLLLLTSLTCIAIATSTTNASAQTKATATVTAVESWDKSTTGTFVCADGRQYKLKTSDGSVTSSANGTTWEAVNGGTWQDKDGKWIKMSAGKLMWSADQGQNWREVPKWTWTSGGKTYKFDASWNLMVKK